MANGDYDDLNWYRSRLDKYRIIVCADGGANWARRLGIIPDLIIGDMDSIKNEERSFMEDSKTQLITFSQEKDFTDTYLAMEEIAKRGIKNFVVWGGTGGRLDHTLTNLFSAAFFAKQGIQIQFQSPTVTIHLIIKNMLLKGEVGDTVSVLALERAKGVSLIGFKYPLEDVTLELDKPIGLSNIITEPDALICVDTGVLAIIHNHLYSTTRKKEI